MKQGGTADRGTCIDIIFDDSILHRTVFVLDRLFDLSRTFFISQGGMLMLLTKRWRRSNHTYTGCSK